MRSILAIFKDECDAGAWAAYLDGISALLTITAHQDLWQSVDRVRKLGIEPAVVIVSSRLYPGEDPDLAARLKSSFPKTQILLLSPSDEPVPPLQQLAVDTVRHLTAGDAADKGYFEWVLEKLVKGSPLCIGERLASPEALRTFEVHSSHQKEPLLDALDEIIVGKGAAFEMFRQRAALLADELIENALYGAPRDSDGNKLFNKGEPRVTLPGERLVFSFGFDGETLAMEITDSWGTLEPDLVVDYLARNHAPQGSTEEMGGRGLFLIWRFFDRFHVSVSPGQKSVVGGDLRLSHDLDPDAPRGFHITEYNKEI